MLTEERIRKILKDRYSLETGRIGVNIDELIYSFKMFHKMLAGLCNTNQKGRIAVSDKYCKMRDMSGGKIKAIAECIEIW